MRQMKDSTNPAAIPVGTPLVAGYVAPSRFAWTAAQWARFPGSVLVRITPNASTHGAGIHVLDVETGDATAAQVPGWCIASRAAGQDPTIYTALGNWAAVIQACINAGVVVPQFWIAEWDGVQQLPSITVDGVTYTAVAKQYADPAHGSGGDWDSSIVADVWPGVDIGADVALTPDDINLLFNTVVPGSNGQQFGPLLGMVGSQFNVTANSYGGTVSDRFNAIDTAVGAVNGAITAEQTAVLTAISSIQAGAPTDAQMAALTTALEAALPSYTVSIAPKTS